MGLCKQKGRGIWVREWLQDYEVLFLAADTGIK